MKFDSHRSSWNILLYLQINKNCHLPLTRSYAFSNGTDWGSFFTKFMALSMSPYHVLSVMWWIIVLFNFQPWLTSLQSFSTSSLHTLCWRTHHQVRIQLQISPIMTIINKLIHDDWVCSPWLKLCVWPYY